MRTLMPVRVRRGEAMATARGRGAALLVVAGLTAAWSTRGDGLGFSMVLALLGLG